MTEEILDMYLAIESFIDIQSGLTGYRKVGGGGVYRGYGYNPSFI